MNKITDLDDVALAWLLDTLEKHPEKTDEVKRIVHDLFVHQVELEQQNRELQAIQEKLEQSRDRYSDLYDFAPVAYVTLDASGVIQEINLAGAELLGKERQKLIGMSLAGFAKPGSRRGVLSFLRRFSERIDPGSEVFSLTGTDGRESIVRAQGYAEPSSQLRYIALVDVTATQQAEQALAQREDDYRMLVENSAVLISCQEPSGIFLYVSPSCREVLGYEPEALIGRSAFELLHPDDLDTVRVSHASVLSSLSTGVVQCRIRRMSGNYTWFETKIRSVAATGNAGNALIVAEHRKIPEPEQVAR